MEIDIIAFSDSQFALLTNEQLEEVKSVQLRKNRLTAALEEKKRKAKYKLVEQGAFRSSIFDEICAKLNQSYQEEVESLRSGLLFYLRFSVKSDGTQDAPYEIDYSKTYEERYNVVKAYYDTTYSTASERLEALKNDRAATGYLGEYYSTLFDYYAVRAET